MFSLGAVLAEMVVIGARTDVDKGVGVGAGGGAAQQTPMESGNISPPCPSCLGVPNLIGVPSFPIFKISFMCSILNKQDVQNLTFLGV